MKRQGKSKFVKIMSLVLALIMVLTCFAPVLTYAAEPEEENNFIVTGKYAGGFDLKVSSENLCKVSNMAPGDVYKGKITVENTGPDKMEIAITDISSKIDDEALYNKLMLKISHDGKVLYDGNYSDTPDPVIKFLAVKAKGEIELDVEVEFPQYSTNDFQGKELDALWTFEANYYNKEKVQTGHELSDENPMDVYFPFIVLLSAMLLGVAIMLIIIAKKRDKDKKQN